MLQLVITDAPRHESRNVPNSSTGLQVQFPEPKWNLQWPYSGVSNLRGTKHGPQPKGLLLQGHLQKGPLPPICRNCHIRFPASWSSARPNRWLVTKCIEGSWSHQFVALLATPLAPSVKEQGCRNKYRKLPWLL